MTPVGISSARRGRCEGFESRSSELRSWMPRSTGGRRARARWRLASRYTFPDRALSLSRGHPCAPSFFMGF